MLGSTIFRYLTKKKNLAVFGTYRSEKKKNLLIKYFKKISNQNFFLLKDLHFKKIEKLIKIIKPDLVINCLGAIKQKKAENSEILKTNALFPKTLFKLSQSLGFKLIQISTDCVFSGDKGNYLENDKADAEDIYGKSKFLGEVIGHNCITIRTSIIGPELNSKDSLLEWFLSKKGSKVFGYKNAYFNGFTTLELSKIIYKYFVLSPTTFKTGLLLHVSSKKISKYNLLKLINATYNCKTIIIPEYKTKIDRTLSNKFFKKKFNYKFLGWSKIIKEMKNFK